MIETTLNKYVYTVTARENPGVFAFPVRFWNADEIVVAIGGTTQMTDQRLTRGIEYDVVGEDFAEGGTVCLNYGTGVLPALPAMLGKSVTVARELPLIQSLSLPTHGVLPSGELEGELDKVICIIQQHEEALSRCAKAPLGSGISADNYMAYIMQQVSYSVQSCVYSAESAAASAANSAAVAAFVGNCMTEITGNTSYAQKAAESFYNVEKQYGAVIASGTTTLLAVTGAGLNAVSLTAQSATVDLQAEGLAQQESLAGVGGTYTAKIAQAEGEMAIYLAGCSAAALYAGTSTVEIQAMSASVAHLKQGVEASVETALEAGTVCIIQAGSSSYYMTQSQAALRDAQVALSGCTSFAGDAAMSANDALIQAGSASQQAGSAAQSAADALARAGDAARSAANAYAAELAAGTIAQQTANQSIVVHNASALAHQDIRNDISTVSGSVTTVSGSVTTVSGSVTAVSGSVTALSETVAALSGSVTALDNAKAPLESPAFTGTPTAPTATAGDNSTRIATTAFVLLTGGTVKQGKPNYSAASTPAWTATTGIYVSADGWMFIHMPADGADKHVCVNGYKVGANSTDHGLATFIPVVKGNHIDYRKDDGSILSKKPTYIVFYPVQ